MCIYFTDASHSACFFRFLKDTTVPFARREERAAVETRSNVCFSKKVYILFCGIAVASCFKISSNEHKSIASRYILCGFLCEPERRNEILLNSQEIAIFFPWL